MNDYKHLQTVANFAASNRVTASYIYRLGKDKTVEIVVIDGIKFVDIKKTKWSK